MAKILDIVTDPDKRLRMVSEPVDPETISGLSDLFADMKLTMREKDGVGLAAPQIGRNVRIIVIAGRDGEIVLVNPTLSKLSFFKEWGEEGCLSVPLMYGQVQRHRGVVCKYLDENGKPQTIKAYGLQARVLQHEIDHLDGILFIDKARDLERYQPKG